MPGGEWFVWRVRLKRTASHEPLATNHYAPPARIATCVFGVRHPRVEPRQGVFVTQASSWGAWLGVAVRRGRRDAGVELKSSRNRQQKFLKEFNLDFSDVAFVSPVRT